MNFTRSLFRVLHFAFCLALAAIAASDATLEQNARIVFDAVLPNGQGIIISLGRGKERLYDGTRGHCAFLVWHDAKGATSKPSAPFKFRLKDVFAEK